MGASKLQGGWVGRAGFGSATGAVALQLGVRTLKKIVSGGQTGADQGALRAARDCGLQIGGWCPPGRVCEAGVIPTEFPLTETPGDRSADAPHVPRSQRTEWNVRDSDGTLVIQASVRRDVLPRVPFFNTRVENKSDARKRVLPRSGTERTIECARRYQRPLLICEVDDSEAKKKIGEWLETNAIVRLNVAGPAESISPGIGDKAYGLLLRVFEL